MSSPTSNLAKTASKKDPQKLLIQAGLAIGGIVAVLAILSSFNHTGEQRTPRAQASGSTYAGTRSGTLANQTSATPYAVPLCAPFTEAGSSCDIGTDGSGWVRARQGAPTTVQLCWRPGKRDLWKEVKYLDGDGQSHVYDFDHPPATEKVDAYWFVPAKGTVTLTYELSEHPCAND